MSDLIQLSILQSKVANLAEHQDLKWRQLGKNTGCCMEIKIQVIFTRV